MHLKIGHLNVRSLVHNFHSVKEFLITGGFDLFTISESWLHSGICSDIVGIENYNFFRNDRQSRGGGVGIYANNNLNIKILNTPADVSIEQLWFTVNLCGKLCAFCVIYRAPNINLHELIATLDVTLSDIIPTVDAVVITGDLNVDFLSVNSSSFSYISNILESYSLSQVVDQPTRVTGQSQTLIDVIITSDLNLIKTVNVVDSGAVLIILQLSAS